MAITGTKEIIIVYKNETLHIETLNLRKRGGIRILYYSYGNSRLILESKDSVQDRKDTVLKRKRRLKFIYTREL